MKSYLWIAYDYASTSECLSILDTILEHYSNHGIIHAIGSSTLLQALLEGKAIASKFCQRLSNYQTIVADLNAIAVGKAITHSRCPNLAIAQFLTEINKLVPFPTVKKSYTSQVYPDATWAAIDAQTSPPLSLAIAMFNYRTEQEILPSIETLFRHDL